jgi:hypothetical protein
MLLSNLPIGSTPPALSASTTSGLTILFTSNTTSICTVSGTTVTIVAQGTCSITASQSGNATYAPAASVTQTFMVLPPAPVVNSVTPFSTLVSSPATPVTVAGANFATGSTVTFTPPGGSPTTITPSLIQAAQIAATIPATLLTTAGTAEIAVTNGSGTLSNQVPFYILPFSISSVTPNSTPAGSRDTQILVSGQNLSTATTLVGYASRGRARRPRLEHRFGNAGCGDHSGDLSDLSRNRSGGAR